jgi:hypothetical protein
MREQLLGYLLGALDEPERSAVEQRLKTDRAWQEEVERLRELLGPLTGDCTEIAPPLGLARKTCRYVEEVEAAATRIAAAEMVTVASPLRWSFQDTLVATAVVAALILILLPAFGNSRFHSEVVGCQNNLRQLGMALVGYSSLHGGEFPSADGDGALGVAGSYALLLQKDGLLTETQLLICPAGARLRDEPLQIPTWKEIARADPVQLAVFRGTVGGDYGYNLGVVIAGRYQPVRNQARENFALMADAPSPHLDGRPSNNHGSFGQNMLFEPGHVKFIRTRGLRLPLEPLVNDQGIVAAGLHPNDAVIAPSHAAPLIWPRGQ